MIDKVAARFRRASPGASGGPDRESNAVLPETAEAAAAAAASPAGSAAEAPASDAPEPGPKRAGGEKGEAKQTACEGRDGAGSGDVKIAARTSRLVEPAKARAAPMLDFAGLGAKLSAATRSGSQRALPALAAGICLSFAGGYWLGAKGADGVGAVTLSRVASDLQLSREAVTELSAEIKAIKASVGAASEESGKLRRELAARQTELGTALERTGQAQVARLDGVAEQVGRMERAQREPSRLQPLTERLDRIEKALANSSGMTTKPVAAAGAPVADVAQTGSIPESKPPADPRKTQLEGYFVRDIDGGYALVETRSGRYVEVAVGHTVPGLGRVEAIERRGRQWVVVTPKGYIGER